MWTKKGKNIRKANIFNGSITERMKRDARGRRIKRRPLSIKTKGSAEKNNRNGMLISGREISTRIRGGMNRCKGKETEKMRIRGEI